MSMGQKPGFSLKVQLGASSMELKAEIASTDASRQYTPDKVCLEHPLAPDEYFKKRLI